MPCRRRRIGIHRWVGTGNTGHGLGAIVEREAMGGPTDDRGMPFEVHVDRCAEHLRMSREQLAAALPENARERPVVRGWDGATPEEKAGATGITGAFLRMENVDAFVRALHKAVA